MKSLRKTLAFLVALTMVLGTVATAFAATPSDVVGSDYESAVVKLGSLGVISGYPDGTFKPENSITRAEFAKIACYVIGVQNAAELSKGTTKFNDVPATHWASGYINIASEKGMIKGYPDGSFKPEANVSYAEAVTILVRALGMAPVVEGKGTWPANYLAKASSAGITSDVSGIDGSAKAVRGNIAKLAWNTLTAEKWGEIEYTSTGVTYGPIGKSLLADQYKDYSFKNADNKYVAKEFEDVRVVATQTSGLDADQIGFENEDEDLRALLDGEEADSSLTADVAVTGMDLNSLYGKKCNILLGKDNKVVSIIPNNEDTVVGFITKIDTSENKVEINDSKSYSFATSPAISVNMKAYTLAQLADVKTAIGNSEALATIVLDGSKIKYLTISVADKLTTLAGITMKQAVINEVKSNGEVKDIDGNVLFDIDTITADTDKLVIVKDGKVATKDDIKVGDVVTYVKRAADSFYYIALSDVKVTGTVTKITSDVAGDVGSQVRRKLTIDGKVYEMVNDGTAMVSTTGDIEDGKAVATESNYKDYYNKTATLYLNVLGRVEMISGSVKASATLQVGVVSKGVREGTPDSNGNTVNYITILNQDGLKKTYTLKGDEYNKIYSGASAAADAVAADSIEDGVDDAAVDLGGNLAIGATVVYDVSTDGTIDAANLYELTDSMGLYDETNDLYVLPVGVLAGVNTTDSIDNDNMKITSGAKAYYATTSTKVINAVSDEDVVESIQGWDSVVNDTNNLLNGAKLVYDGRIIKTIITAIPDVQATNGVTGPTNYANVAGATADELELLSDNEARYGIFKEINASGDDDTITVVEGGKDVTYTVSGSVYSSIEEGDVVRFTLNGDGEFVGDNGGVASDGCILDITEAVDWADATLEKYEIDSVATADRIVTFTASMDRDDTAGTDNTDSVKLATDVVVYDVRDGKIATASVSDLSKGLNVFVGDYDSTDDVYGLVVIFN